MAIVNRSQIKFRVVTTAGEFFVMFVIHEGIPTADYEFDLPRALFVGQAYRLDFFIDHDNSGGYNAPGRPCLEHRDSGR